jgi:hypothetical protein
MLEQLTPCDYCHICYTNKQIPKECKCLYCGYVEPGVHPANARKIEDKHIRVWKVNDQDQWIHFICEPRIFIHKQHIDWNKYKNDSELGPWAKILIERRYCNAEEVIKLVKKDIEERKKLLLLPEHFWEFYSINPHKSTINLYQKDKTI